MTTPEPGVDLADLGVSHGVVVRPGDTLIVGLSRSDLRPEQPKHLREQFEERLPGIKVVVVGDVAQFAVYRPGGSGPSDEDGHADTGRQHDAQQ